MSAQAIIPDTLLDAGSIGGIVSQVLDDAAADVQKQFQGTVEAWNEKPKFSIESPTAWQRNIYTRNQIYQWVNDGTPAHEILPVTAHALSFMTGGVSKSQVGSLASRPGGAGGNPVMARSVHHPGVRARQFDLLIWSEWEDGRLAVRLQSALDWAVR